MKLEVKLTEPAMHLTAKEFWQNYQWLGRKNFLPNLQKPRMSDWHTRSVQELFENANWSGNKGTQTLPSNMTKNLEFGLTVKDFFQCFSWQRKQKITEARIIDVPQNSNQPEKPSLLSELSQLF